MRLTKTLKILAAAMYFWAFFPLMITASDVLIFYHISMAKAAAQLAVITLSGFFGYGVSGLSEKICPRNTRGWRLFLINVIRYLGALLPLAAGLLLFSAPSANIPFPIMAAVPPAVIMTVLYFVGQSLYFKPYYDILKFPVVLFHIICGTSLGIIGWILQYNGIDVSFPMDFIVVVFLIFVSVYAISKSQGTLDYVMDRRGHKMSALPGNIRRYNLLLVCVLIAVLAVAFLFRRPIGAFLVVLKDGLMFAVKCILAFLIYLMTLFGGSSEGESTSSGASGEMDLSFLDTGRRIPDFTILILVLVIGGLLLFNWKKIIAGIRKLWKSLGKLSRKLFWGRKEAYGRQDESLDYVDEEESLTEEASVRENGEHGWKKWRKACRAFRKMEDSEEKLRRGYRLIVEWLKLKGVDVQRSDTPLEILKKAESSDWQKAGAQGLTNEYNGIRYGEKQADRNLLSELVETIRTLEAGARPDKKRKKAK